MAKTGEITYLGIASMTNTDPTSRGIFLRSAAFALALCVLTLMVGLLIAHLTISQPDPARLNVFHVLYVRDEIIGLMVMILALFILSVFVGCSLSAVKNTEVATGKTGPRSWLLLGTGVLALTSAGTFLVYHNYPLSLDEYLAGFQARIFASGHLTAAVPPQWQEFGDALAPKLLPIEETRHAWVSNYLPVWSGVLALFQLLHAQWLAGPLLAAGSIGMLAAVRTSVDAAWKWDPWVAALFLATSSQFIINAMTLYAMTAHLFFNLVWLWLYTRPNRSGLKWAAWVGFLAIGLHQPIVHLLFASPFLVRLLREKAWFWFAYFAAVYLGALVCYSFWLALAHFPDATPGDPSLHGVMATPSMIQIANQALHAPSLAAIFIQLENLGLLLAWSSPLGILCLILSANYISRWPTLARDLFYGVLVTVVFYVFFKSDQGHGWGYRYCHGVLGNLAILAAMGFELGREQISRATTERILYLNVLIVLLIMLPMRSYQVETFVAPFARGTAFLEAQPEPCLLFDHDDLWYGGDFIRNDPLFHGKSLIFSGDRLSGSRRDKLLQQFAARHITGSDLAGLGLCIQPAKKIPDEPTR